MRDFIENVLARGGSAAVQALMMIVLARLTSLTEFGVFGVSQSVGAIALGVLAFGLPTRTLRSQPGDGVAFAAIRVTSTSAAVAACVSAGVSLVVTGSATAVPAFAGGVVIYGEAQNNIYQSVAFGNTRFRRASAVMLSRRVFPLVGVGSGALLGSPDLRSTLIYMGLAVGSLVSVAAGRLIVRPMLRPPPMNWRLLLKESRAYWLANIWSMLQQLDVVVVASLLGSASAAIFSAAFRVASPIHIVTTLITSRLIPAVTAEIGSSDSKNAGGSYLRAGFGYALAVIIASPLLAWISVLVLGSDYEPFVGVFVVLIANSGFSVINQVQAAWIIAHNQLQKWLAPATAISSISGLAIVVTAGINGSLLLASFGTLSIQFILCVIYFVLTARARRNS